MAIEKNLLVINPYLPMDPGKSFHTLILKYLNDLGWNSTIVALPPRDLSLGESRWQVMSSEPLVASPSRTGSVHLFSGNWFGINILEVLPSAGKLSQLSSWLYAQRKRCSSGAKALQAEGKPRSFKIGLFGLGNLALFPFTAIRGPQGALSNCSQDFWDTLLALHEQERFSAVLSVYGTFASHILARRFKDRTGVPWLALIKDFYSRPVYTGRKARDIPSSAHWLINLRRQLHERRVLNHSTLLVPYTDVLADHLATITDGVPIKVIPNCYDDADYVDPPAPFAVAPNDKFIIGSVGRLWDYDLHLFFQALKEIKEEGNCPNMRARFVGADVKLLKAVAENYDCQSLLEIVPVVPHEEAVLEMRRSTCLLSPQVPWELPRRTPEYIATRKPILAFPDCPTAVSQDVLKQYGGAVIASSKEEIKAILLDWYQEFQRTGTVSVQVNEELIESFSARHRALQLSEILEEAIAGCPQVVDRVPHAVNRTLASVTLEKTSR